MVDMIPNAHGYGEEGITTFLDDDALARVEALLRARQVVADDTNAVFNRSSKVQVPTGELVFLADYILGEGEEEGGTIDINDLDDCVGELIDFHGSGEVLDSMRRVIGEQS